MPEGDTLFRTAWTLRPAMVGGVIEHARIRDRQFDAKVLHGHSVTEVEARGKHLLMHLSTGQAVHSHLGMTGSWHIYHPNQAWLKPEHYAALELAINRLVVICFSPKLLELLTAEQLRTHRHLTRLGPDLLGAEFDVPAAVARFRLRNDLPIGEAVMNQTIVCGIGNVYKSDLLFLMKFDPFSAVASFGDEELATLLTKARWLMQRNLGGGARRTRYDGKAGRLWVYGRSGKPCPECGTTILLRRQGDQGRTTCWCPACQPSR